MSLAIIATVFPIIFIGELPDKTMFASLVLSSRGRPSAVWLGAATAFTIHVAIAVTIGAGLFALLPHRLVEGAVAILFFVGAVWALRSHEDEHDEAIADEEAALVAVKTATTAFVVVFIAEWGDLTQILTANLAARYHSPLSVGLGAVLALWAVAAVAVTGGQRLVRWLPVMVVRRITAGALVTLAVISGFSALGG